MNQQATFFEPVPDRAESPRFVASTSRKAYDELKPTLQGRELFVLAELRAYEREHGTQPTSYELVRFAQRNWPGENIDLNTVRPRLTALLNERKLIVKDSKRTCAVTGKTAWTWAVR
jgi:hypothetical protein